MSEDTCEVAGCSESAVRGPLCISHAIDDESGMVGLYSEHDWSKKHPMSCPACEAGFWASLGSLRGVVQASAVSGDGPGLTSRASQSRDTDYSPELPKTADVSDLIVEAVRAVDVYRPILEDAVGEMEAQGLSVAATYREWLSDPAGFRPYAEMAEAFRSLGEGNPTDMKGSYE